MKRRWFAAALVLVAGGIYWLSLQSAANMVPSIASAIERGLGRKVEIRGEAHFLPWRLGFSLVDVVIHDDPRFGLEPIAYVDELQATIRLTALLRGRLEFDRLRLIDPSVNLAQSADGWNFPTLLDQALHSPSGVAPPEVEVTSGLTGGRINVRFGDTKSLYYLSDARLTLEPGSRPDQLSIYFDGVPARTDRNQKGFGRLSARGTVDLSKSHQINLQVALERSAASELLLLFQDRGASVTGFFSGSARVQGPLDALQIDGRLQLHEFERWAWLSGAGRGPAIEWAGVLNWGAQTIHLKTKPDNLPVGVTLDGEHILGAAEWRSVVAVRDAPAQALEHLAQEFGFALPGGTALNGQLNGDISYATKPGLDGRIELTGGTLSLPGKGKADLEPAAIHFAGRGATLEPVTIRQGPDIVRLEAAYQWAGDNTAVSAEQAPGLSWFFSGPELDLGRAREWGMALPGRIQSGKWKGNLRYEAATGGWRGEGDLLDADLDVEGLAAKVHLDSARVRLQGAQFSLAKMAGHIDAVEFHGDYQYDPAAPVHHQLQLQLGDLTAPDIQAWIAPAFMPQSGVLSRTLGLARDERPDWVEGRKLSATLQAKTIRLGDTPVGPVSARVAWSNGVVHITNLVGPGRLRGEGALNLAARGGAPSSITIENIPWRGGLADTNFQFTSITPQAAGSLDLNARGVSLVEGERWMHLYARGEFDSTLARMHFPGIEIRPRAGDDAGTLRGTGESRADGWEFDLKSSGANRKIAGPIFDGFWK